MTDIQITAHELGRAGRPMSPATRRSKLRMEYINAIGVENLTPSISEAILSAVELTSMAAEQRAKIAKAGAASPDDLLAVVRLENAAARAVARLNLPAPTAISTIAAA
jgi:hypothetical protein